MARELFSTSPGAAQMARARLGLALGAFGSSDSSLLAAAHLLSSSSTVAVAESRKRGAVKD